tara:strand:+ start:16095 stop:16652 length:558 start_codon:yes stop_codon:yes gene_type:complete
MKKINTHYLYYFICLFFFSSCSDKQDFDQAKDLEIITDVSGPIVYIESTEALINSIPAPSFLTQNINFDGFETNLFSDKVISGSITFQIENTTSKQVDLTVDLLDDAGNILDTEFFSINASPPAVLINREIFYGSPSGRSIDIVKNTSSILLSFVNNSGNTSVSNLPEPKVIFRSIGSFKLRVIE